MISKLVVTTYITSKVVFILQTYNHTFLPHMLQQVVLLPRAILQHFIPYLHILQQGRSHAI